MTKTTRTKLINGWISLCTVAFIGSALFFNIKPMQNILIFLIWIGFFFFIFITFATLVNEKKAFEPIIKEYNPDDKPPRGFVYLIRISTVLFLLAYGWFVSAILIIAIYLMISIINDKIEKVLKDTQNTPSESQI